MNPKIFVFLIVLFFLCINVKTAFGHGLGFEVLPPVSIGNRNATLSIFVNPPTFDPNNKEYDVAMNLVDSKTQDAIKHVTYLVELVKDDKTIFKYKFRDDLGKLYFKIVQNDSDHISVIGKEDQNIGWTKNDDSNPLRLEGPVFTSGGLYKFNIQILTVDSDENFLATPPVLNSAISLAEKISYDVTTKSGDKNKLSLTSYYDKIKNFQYVAEPQTMSFGMPFDWSDKTLSQITIVHIEVHIPKSFLDMISTDYDATVNGVALPESSIQVDDYSEDENRVVHLVIAREQLFAMRDDISELTPEMNFMVNPAREVRLPLSAYANAQYQVDLWWDPTNINANEPIKFYVDLRELYKVEREPTPTSFDFVLTKDNTEFYRKTIQTQLNGKPKSVPIEYQFSKDQTGLITVYIQKISGNTLATSQFNIVVNQEAIPAKIFPIRLESMKGSEPGSGKYYVDLTWFPSDLRVNEQSEFVITMYDKATGQPIPQAKYDFVLLNGQNEVLRKEGFAKAGGSFEDYMFSESDKGQLKLRIENINDSSEFVEIPLSVTPEFPVFVILVFLLSVIFSVLAAKLLNKKLVLPL